MDAKKKGRKVAIKQNLEINKESLKFLEEAEDNIVHFLVNSHGLPGAAFGEGRDIINQIRKLKKAVKP